MKERGEMVEYPFMGVRVPAGWSGPWLGKYIQKGERRIYRTDDLDFVIADGGGWLPGSFPTVEQAVAGFDAYYRRLRRSAALDELAEQGEGKR